MNDSAATEDAKRKIKEEQDRYLAAQLEQQQYQDLTSDQFEQELIKKYHFKATKDTEELYYYDDAAGVYVKGGEWLIKRECIKYDPEIRTVIVNEITNHIIWANYIDRIEFDPDVEWIACKNVMVNLQTGETKPHSPECMATLQIPHKYPSIKYPCFAAPPKIMQFLHQVMVYENVETVLDFIAYCLWRGFPFHKYLLLNGSGRNGKGVTTNLITRLLGFKNVSGESLHRVLENRFAVANLFGKMANIDADLSSEALKQTGLLKKITGGDQIMGEFKYKPAFPFVNHAKLIFSANKIPITPDESDAFFVRLLIINFPNQFLGDKAIPNLIDELTTESEMSAFLTLLVRRLPRILKSGISYADSHTIEDNYLKYMQSSDPIRFFIETAIQRTTEGYEIKTDVYDSYARFCADKNLGKESSQTFSRKLNDAGIHPIQVRIGGKNQPKIWAWRNIKLRDWKKPDDDDQGILDV